MTRRPGSGHIAVASAATLCLLLGTVSGATGNEVLDGLPSNTWTNLNPTPTLRYIPVFADPDATEALTPSDRVLRPDPLGRSYSGTVYGDGKIFYFGGAHQSYPGNDVEVYDIENNFWTQALKPEVPPGSDPMYGGGGSPNLSPTGRPYTIHGYARTTYAADLKRYVCTATYSLVSFDPVTLSWTWLAGQHAPNGEPAWVPDDANLSQWDAALGGILAYRGTRIWLYRNGTVTERQPVTVNLASSGSGGAASVYIPEIQSHMIAVLPQGGSPAPHVYLYHSVNQTIREVTSMPAALQGQLAPEGNFVMAYDTVNRRVACFTAEDVSGSIRVRTWIYDPVGDTWQLLPISPSSPVVRTFTASSRSPIQYDPTHNVFVFVVTRGVNGTSGATETWAYRFQGGGSPLPTDSIPPNRVTDFRSSP